MHPETTASLLYLPDAPATPSPTGGLLQSLPLLVAILAIFYFLMIRPQQKQAKEHENLLASLKKDDQVVLMSGLHGRIWAVEDTTLVLEVARDIRVKVDKAAVRRRLASTGDTPASAEEGGDKKSRKGA